MHASALVNLLQSEPRFRRAFELQVATQREFYERAGRIVSDACPMGPPPGELQSIERNFFSTFFLVATELLVGRSENLPLYAMVNQGMRAWVTACDNLLDDEYKEIFPFDLPGCGTRTRSVLTLLIADRVVTEFALDRYAAALVEQVGRISLRALLPSAIQEGGEEVRPVVILPPEEILREVHQLKTGDLFAAPLALPRSLETPGPGRVRACLAAVESFGLACQVLDDVKDMPDDVRSGRHNLLVSLIAHGVEAGTDWLDRLRAEPEADWAAWERFPDAAAEAGRLAVERFGASFRALAELGLELSGPEQDALVGCMCGLLRVPVPPVAQTEEVGG